MKATWVWENGTTSGDSGLTDTLCNAPSGDCRPSNATWADGSRKWNSNEPSNSAGGTEDCAVLRDSSGVWNDVRCNNNSEKKYGIFEFDL